MMRWFGPALLAVTLVFGGSTAIKSAVAAPLKAAVQTPQASQPTDISARRYYRHYHHHYVYRRYYRPYYYARPYYYRPYPYYAYTPYYAPAPFPLSFGIGLGFGPWW